jgi:zinc transport system ATP-binding protein
LQGRLERGKLFFDRKDRKIAQEVLERVGLWDLRKKRIAQLSGGQRQKALLARALAAKPKIVILDEPTASIDPQGQKEIYEILQNLDLTRIVVSHDINILFTGVDRIAYINRKLYIHENPKIDIHPNKEHFCQIDLFQELARSCENG